MLPDFLTRFSPVIDFCWPALTSYWAILSSWSILQYIPRNMHTFFALLCFVVVIHWLIFPYPSGLLHWHCGNLTIAPVPAKQPWWIWINTSCEFIMNDCITTTKQSTTKPCAYFLGYTVCNSHINNLCFKNIMRHYGGCSTSTGISGHLGDRIRDIDSRLFVFFSTLTLTLTYMLNHHC